MSDQLGFTLLSRALYDAGIWLAVAFLAGLMAAAIFRPERIGYPGRFRIAYFLFALYILIPAVGDWLFAMMGLVEGGNAFTSYPRPSGFGNGSTGATILLSMAGIGAKVCLALGIICAMASFCIGERQE